MDSMHTEHNEQDDSNLLLDEENHIKRKGKIVLYAIILLSVLTVFFLAQRLETLNRAPEQFPTYYSFTITEGETTRTIAERLEEEYLIRSSSLFHFMAATLYPDTFIQAGTHYFETPLSTKSLIDALMYGTHTAPPLSVTFPEGFRIARMHEYLPESLHDTELEEYTVYEGYLFPDTYFIDEDSTLEELIERMRVHFDEMLLPYETEIAESSLTRDEIITLASIVEREGNTRESMEIIAGILLTRLDIGMALQVDATFDYLLGKESAELTLDDLAIDSPYNTYQNPGLPPGPIANPGLMAIEAVLRPKESEYLYYLTGNDGNFYYAETFDAHVENKNRYLR